MLLRSLCGVAVLVLAQVASGCASTAAVKRQAPADPLAAVPSQQLFARGVELSRAGDFVRAEQYLSAARDRGVADTLVVPELIDVCIGGGRYQAALRHAAPFLRAHPDDWPLRYLVASLHSATGDASSAQIELEQVVTDHPQAPGPRFLLGMILSADPARQGAAAAELETYVTLAPRGPHAAEANAWLRRHRSANQ